MLEELEMQIHLSVLGACCIVSVCLCHCILKEKPVSSTVCEQTTDSLTAFCMLK